MWHTARNRIGPRTPAVWGIGLLLASAACSPGQATQPAGETAPAARPAATLPAATQSAPASQPVDSNALRILQDLEAVGRKYPMLEANVWFHLYKKLEQDEELRTGRVVVARGDGKAPDRLYICFDTLKQGPGATIKEKVEWALDGLWLTEARHKIQSLTRRQVAVPGQKVELFRLGQGPFPMPFGQKAADVLEHFQASTRPPVKTDPNGTDYVKLVTRPAYKDELSFLYLEMWVDRDTRLPVRLVTEDKNSVVRTAVFSGVRPSEKVDEKLFRIESKPGWQLNIMPLKKE